MPPNCGDYRQPVLPPLDNVDQYAGGRRRPARLGLAPVWDSTRYKGMHFPLLARYRRFPLPLATAEYQ
jgi:hypothetical protein